MQFTLNAGILVRQPFLAVPRVPWEVLSPAEAQSSAVRQAWCEQDLPVSSSL